MSHACFTSKVFLFLFFPVQFWKSTTRQSTSIDANGLPRMTNEALQEGLGDTMDVRAVQARPSDLLRLQDGGMVLVDGDLNRCLDITITKYDRTTFWIRVFIVSYCIENWILNCIHIALINIFSDNILFHIIVVALLWGSPNLPLLFFARSSYCVRVS